MDVTDVSTFCVESSSAIEMTSTQVVERQSQPTTVLLRTTQARPNDSEDHFHTGCPNVSHNQQQSFSGLHKPDPMTLKITSTQVVQTSVTTNNSPSQDYTSPTQ